jgi:VWFA-related protein
MKPVLRMAGALLLITAMAWSQASSPQSESPRTSPQGASADAQSRPELPVFKTQSEEVLIDVLALERKSRRPIISLQASDLRVLEDGVPQPIVSFSRDELPLSIVLLFDLTDTVRPVLKPLAKGARAVLEHLKPQDEVSVMVFSSSAQVLQDFTTDRDLAVRAIERASRMESTDATFLNEDVVEGVAQLRAARNPQGRRVLVWLTDGTANIPSDEMRAQHGRLAPAYVHTEKEARRALLASGAVVTALIEESELTEREVMRARFDAKDLLQRSAFPPGDIRRFADLTGGTVVSEPGRKTAARLAQLLDELRARYTIGYRPLMERKAGTYCAVRVELAPESAARLGKVTLRARAGYYRSER